MVLRAFFMSFSAILNQDNLPYKIYSYGKIKT